MLLTAHRVWCAVSGTVAWAVPAAWVPLGLLLGALGPCGPGSLEPWAATAVPIISQGQGSGGQYTTAQSFELALPGRPRAGPLLPVT